MPPTPAFSGWKGFLNGRLHWSLERELWHGVRPPASKALRSLTPLLSLPSVLGERFTPGMHKHSRVTRYILLFDFEGLYTVQVLEAVNCVLHRKVLFMWNKGTGSFQYRAECLAESVGFPLTGKSGWEIGFQRKYRLLLLFGNVSFRRLADFVVFFLICVCQKYGLPVGARSCKSWRFPVTAVLKGALPS